MGRPEHKYFVTVGEFPEWLMLVLKDRSRNPSINLCVRCSFSHIVSFSIAPEFFYVASEENLANPFSRGETGHQVLNLPDELDPIVIDFMTFPFERRNVAPRTSQRGHPLWWPPRPLNSSHSPVFSIFRCDRFVRWGPSAPVVSSSSSVSQHVPSISPLSLQPIPTSMAARRARFAFLGPSAPLIPPFIIVP